MKRKIVLFTAFALIW